MSELLPQDIQVEILLRLPVKSLLSFKCICKSWCYLISDPNFIKNHLKRGIQTNNHRLMVNCHNLELQGRGSNPREECTLGFASISLTSSQTLPCDGYNSVDYPFQDIKESDYVRILGSSNGLICICIVDITKYENDAICIWNPSTREYKEVPLFRKSDFSSSIYGFGCDGVNDDYKLVRIDNNFNIQVYTLGSDSWSKMRKIPCCIWITFFRKRDTGLFFNGALHWLGVVQETSIEVFVSFNLNNERIVEIPLPEALLTHPKDKKLYWKKGVNVGVLEDYLCLVLFGDFWYTVDVWVMKDYGVRESWTKRFTIINQDKWFAIFKLWSPIWTFKNGDILANHTVNGCMLVKNHKESVMRNLKEVEIREVCISCVGIQKVLESVIYVESLVSLNSGTYVGKGISNIETHITPEIKKQGNVLERLLEFIEKLITINFYS